MAKDGYEKALFFAKHIDSYQTTLVVTLVAVSVFFFVGYVEADTSTASVVVGNSVPTLTVSLNRTTITLTENSYVWASTTLTITDGNGLSRTSTRQACS